MQGSSHADQAAWNDNSWSSVEVRVRHDTRSAEGKSAYIEEHYIEQATGERFYGNRMFAQGKPLFRISHYFDGRRGMDLTFDATEPDRQGHAVVHRHFGNEDRSERPLMPAPLIYNHVGSLGLHEALPQATKLGQDRVMRRDCDVFLFPQVKWVVPQDHVYYLDRATFVPLKIEAFLNEAERKEDRPIWTWTAQELDVVQGHPLVVRSEQKEYMDGQLYMTRTFRVEEAAFDKEYPPETFWPVLQTGVMAFNPETGKAEPVPGKAAPKSDTAAGSAEAATSMAGPTEATRTTAEVTSPIRAEVPRGWASYATPAGLALGLAALVAGAVLIRRRG